MGRALSGEQNSRTESNLFRFIGDPLSHRRQIGTGAIGALVRCLQKVQFTVEASLDVTEPTLGHFQLFLHLLVVKR